MRKKISRLAKGSSSGPKNYLSSFDSLLFYKAVFSILLLYTLSPALTPDEAQYWVWSQYLDFGYYSKPPGIAYLLKLAESIFGIAAESLRLPSIILSCIVGLLFEKTLLKLELPKTIARNTMRLFVFSPLILFGSFAATTDVGLLTFYCALLRVLVDDSLRFRKFLLVLLAFLGSLFKPLILILACSQFLLPPAKRSSRLQDFAFMAFGCTLMGLLALVWNINHDFVTFRHILGQLTGQGSNSSGSFSFTRPFFYLLGQLALLSPLIGIKLASSLKSNWGTFFEKKEDLSPFDRWKVYSGRLILLILSFVFLFGFKVKYQANWIIFLYPHLFILLAAYFLKRPFKVSRLVRFHMAGHTGLFITLCLFAQLQSSSITCFHLPWKVNIFKQAAGYKQLCLLVANEKIPLEDRLVISDKYQTVSQLSFYLRPGCYTPVYWFNLHGARKSQFSFYKPPQTFIDSRAIFMAVENKSIEEMEKEAALYVERLKPYFKSIGKVHLVKMVGSRDVKTLLWMELEGYLGNRPQDPSFF